MASPVDPLYLDAWIEATIRRRESYARRASTIGRIVHVGDLEIDIPNRSAKTPFRLAELSERELRLLLFLAENRDRVCRRDEILQAVWGQTGERLHSTLNTHINRIRAKIEDNLKSPQYLVGVYGVGYRLQSSWDTPLLEPEQEPVPR